MLRSFFFAGSILNGILIPVVELLIFPDSLPFAPCLSASLTCVTGGGRKNECENEVEKLLTERAREGIREVN